MRVLGRQDVIALVDVADLVPVIGEAMRAVSARAAGMPLRQALALPGGNRLGVMPGWLGAPACYGAKLLSLFPDNPAQGRSSHAGLMLLFDMDTGLPRLCMDASVLTALRTAAASAVATLALARAEARVAAIVGTGEQAASHVAAMRAARPQARLVVWGRDAGRTRAFALAHGAEPAGSLAAALQGADIVCTTTAAEAAFLHAAMLPAGVHVNAVGASVPSARELAPDCIAALRVFTDYRPSLEAQAGEVIGARAAGLIAEDYPIAEIGEVLSGTATGRRDAEERTLYRSLGVVAQDLAAAAFVLARAEASGAGVTVAME